MKEVFTEMDPKNIESEYLNEEAPRGGHNVKQLAAKYGYSEKWIRKMINNNKNKKWVIDILQFNIIRKYILKPLKNIAIMK